MPLLFCNIGWMERYQGLGSGDRIKGGGTYVKEEGRGHEICNFSSYRNKVYGYVQPPAWHINVDRLGAPPESNSIGGVSVVWTATRPGGGTVIVGWYRNATVFRHYQEFRQAPTAHRNNGIDGYWIAASANDATLLPIDARLFEIPRQVKGGMGQSNVWYADTEQSGPLVKRVDAFIGGARTPRILGGKRGNKQDQERKARIERAAIRACSDHFEKLGYEVASVEKDNLGWDLQARSGRSILRIEVKGLSSDAFSIELTPNEYQAFLRQDDNYRLVVVLNALSSPMLSVCRYSKEERAWLIDGKADATLRIQVRESASIKCI